jgi:hypothetical protein
MSSWVRPPGLGRLLLRHRVHPDVIAFHVKQRLACVARDRKKSYSAATLG